MNESESLGPMPAYDQLQSELEVFELMISGYVGSIVRAAKLVPDEKWNWSFSERTPTSRETCEHTFVWLWCDRQQLTVSDWSLHRPTPDLPQDREAMIALLQDEAIEWRRLIRSLKPEQLNEKRETWDKEFRPVRSFLFHMGQHVIYKAGQMWILAYELGLDGTGPYTAPHPHDYDAFPKVAPWPAPRK